MLYNLFRLFKINSPHTLKYIVWQDCPFSCMPATILEFIFKESICNMQIPPNPQKHYKIQKFFFFTKLFNRLIKLHCTVMYKEQR